LARRAKKNTFVKEEGGIFPLSIKRDRNIHTLKFEKIN
jgi:hypothetical protein